jgi:hypothetical protein
MIDLLSSRGWRYFRHTPLECCFWVGEAYNGIDGIVRPGSRRFWCQLVRLFLVADLGMALAALGLDLSQLNLYDITILLGSGNGNVFGKC